MPAGDGTGPRGTGPRAGRGMGWCASGAGACRRGSGLDTGRGVRQSPAPGVSRRDRGARTGGAASGVRAVSLDELKGHAKRMEESLNAVRSRIAEIEAEASPPFDDPT